MFNDSSWCVMLYYVKLGNVDYFSACYIFLEKVHAHCNVLPKGILLKYFVSLNLYGE